MSEGEILDVLTQIARDLLGDDAITLTEKMTGPDVPGWDSATYINFIVGVELKFRVKFPLADIESFHTFGDVARAVTARIS
jgi:acyl carrier protein